MMQGWSNYNCPMMGGGGGIMMITMSVIWILIVIALLPSIGRAAQYLRSGRNDR